jgi:hypothetical protein
MSNLWRGFCQIKEYFPFITEKKEDFFRALSQRFPLEDPEIQSFDGEYIDVLWSEDFFFSITPEDNFSVTRRGMFHYFLSSEEMMYYLDEHVSHTR